MKKLSLVFLILFSMLLLCSCSKPSFKPDEKVFFSRPKDTNLEFWISEKFVASDFAACEEYPSTFNTMYYGTGYKQGDEKCVVYTIGSYSPNGEEGSYITDITISDPDVFVYALTINSSVEEFETKMQSNGFVVDLSEKGDCPIAQKGNLTVMFLPGNWILLYLDVDTIY